MKLTDKRFWIWEIALTLSLSALPLMLYGDNIGIVTLIIVSYAIAGAIGLMFSSKTRCVLTGFLMFVISVGAYIIDIILIAAFRLIEMEPYPLIMGQICFLPIYLFVNGLVCIVGGIIMRLTKKRNRRQAMENEWKVEIGKDKDLADKV